MNIKESGIIVFMANYPAALNFYTEQLGFRIREQGEDLAVLQFGESYLMIENNGVSAAAPEMRTQNPIVLRLDVYDFDDAVKELQERGVEVSVKAFEWGTIAVIFDPEGNRIELKKAG